VFSVDNPGIRVDDLVSVSISDDFIGHDFIIFSILKMHYYNGHGQRVSIFNSRPRNLSAGGIIKDDPRIKNKKDDTISSWLEYGSLVVPVPVMKSGIMDGYHGLITGQKQHRMTQLGKTVVMPNELVVNKAHAKQVETYLLKHGIRLPLGK